MINIIHNQVDRR